MKKVKFIKDHVNNIKEGQVGDFKTGVADYLVRIGVAEYVEETEPKQAVAQAKGKLKQAVKDGPCKTC